MVAWTWERTWAAVRDVASWGLGAWWGNTIMSNPAPADPWEIAVVAGLLGLPFASHADRLRRRGGPDPPSANGQGPDAPSSERASL